MQSFRDNERRTKFRCFYCRPLRLSPHHHQSRDQNPMNRISSAIVLASDLVCYCCGPFAFAKWSISIFKFTFHDKCKSNNLIDLKLISMHAGLKSKAAEIWNSNYDFYFLSILVYVVFSMPPIWRKVQRIVSDYPRRSKKGRSFAELIEWIEMKTKKGKKSLKTKHSLKNQNPAKKCIT